MAEVLLKLVPVILMIAPAAAVVGAKAVIVGAGINEGAGIKVNPAKDALPPGVVKLSVPVDPIPTVATIEEAETTLKDVTGVPPSVMAEVLLKLVPVILMIAPAAAVVGAKAVIVGAGIKVNPAKDVLPPGVVKLSAPVDPEPIIALIVVEERTVKEATAEPPRVITVVPLRLVPVIVSIAPAPAAVGVKLVIVGGDEI
jgi:hypothetical protein